MGEYLTAALVADDPTGMSWQWARSQDGESGWEDIEAATSTKYIPTNDDVGHYLRAAVSYTDGEGNPQSAEAITTDQVALERSGVRCPHCEPEPIWTPTPNPTVRPTATTMPTATSEPCDGRRHAPRLSPGLRDSNARAHQYPRAANGYSHTRAANGYSHTRAANGYSHTRTANGYSHTRANHSALPYH